MEVVVDAGFAVAAVGGHGPGLPPGPFLDPFDRRASVGVRRPGCRVGRRGRGRSRRRCHRPGLWRRTRPASRAGPFAIGRASGSCRLTCRVAPSGMVPAIRCRVCAAIRRVASSSSVRSFTARTSRPRRRPAAASTPPAALSSAAFGSGFPDGSFRVGQQPFGLGSGGLGQVGELGVLAPHHRQRLVFRGGVAGPQLRVQIMRSPAGSTGPVPQLGPGRATGGLDPPTRRGDPVDRLGQQPGVGRIGHVRRDDGGVDPDLGVRSTTSPRPPSPAGPRSTRRPRPTRSGWSASSTWSGAAPAGRSRSGRTAAR